MTDESVRHSAEKDACWNDECSLPLGHDGMHRPYMAPSAENGAPRLRFKCLTLIDGNPCEKPPPHAEGECWARTMTGRVIRPIPPAKGQGGGA